jgi:hypothetical protein
MPKDVFEFPCPCCGKRVEVNVRSGKARAVDPTEKKGNDLDGLIAEQARASERLGSVFEEARSDEDRRAERLGDIFKSAANEAKKDKDKGRRPPSPFDLD